MSEDYRVIEGRIYRRWSEDISKPKLKGKLSFEESLQMLINRCMTCPPEEYPENVHRLFWSIPEYYKDDLLYEEYEGAVEEFEYTIPVTLCGVPVKPEAISPNVERVTETDWKLLFNAIMNCCARRNLLIPVEQVEVITEKE